MQPQRWFAGAFLALVGCGSDDHGDRSVELREQVERETEAELDRLAEDEGADTLVDAVECSDAGTRQYECAVFKTRSHETADWALYRICGEPGTWEAKRLQGSRVLPPAVALDVEGTEFQPGTGRCTGKDSAE